MRAMASHVESEKEEEIGTEAKVTGEQEAGHEVKASRERREIL